LVTFLDADDLWHRGGLRRRLDRLAAAPAVDAVVGTVAKFTCADPAVLEPPPDTLGERYVHVNLGAWVFRRSVFERVGGFDETLSNSSDSEFVARIREHAIPIAVLPGPALYYRTAGQGMTAG